MSKNKIYYGWIIAAACFIFEALALGLGSATSGLYVKPICNSMGFSRGEYSLVFSILSIVNMVICLTFGVVHKKLGVRNIFLIGVLCETGAFITYYSATNIYTIYAGAVLMGVGLMYLGQVPLSLVVSNWFVEKRGTVLGIVLAGSGIGGTILSPLAVSWIVTYGWRMSYLFSMIIVLVFSIPALLVMREEPSRMGLMAFGAEKVNSQASEDAGSVSGINYKEALRTPTLWLMVTATLFFGMSIQAVFLIAPAHLADVGLKSQYIAWVMSIIYFLNLIGKIVFGIVNDKFGIKPVVLLTNISFVFAAIILIFTHSNTYAFAFAVLLGIASVALTLPIPLLTGILFGQKDFGTLLGIIYGSYTIGVALGTPLNGFSFDKFHTYSYSFILQIILDIIAIGLILYALKMKAKASNAVIENH